MNCVDSANRPASTQAEGTSDRRFLDDMRVGTMGRRSRPRRGFSVILVLGLLTIAMAVSYAMMRTQIMSSHLQRNLSRHVDARHAAITGMNAALQKIHHKDWGGVEATFKRHFSKHQWFEVTFETGDMSLSPGDPDYHEYPFRLTLSATGYAVDPADSSVKVVHQVKAVVQLVRRAFWSWPSSWSALQQYTVYQWSNADSCLQFPMHVEGPVLLNSKLRLCEEYPDDAAACRQYLADLESMRAALKADYRPLTGPIYLPFNRSSSSTLALLRASLNVATHDISPNNAEPLNHPGLVSSYQLYPGGKRYKIPVLQQEYGSVLANITLGPDPAGNPLGVFLHGMDALPNLRLFNNTTIRGTVIGHLSHGDLRVEGENVKLLAHNLPALDGSLETVQLPVAILRDNFQLGANSTSGLLTGMVLAWKEFEVARGSPDTAFTMQGRLATGQLKLHGRKLWDFDKQVWKKLLDEFIDQREDPNNPHPIRFFPQWLQENLDLQIEPLLTIQPQSDAVRYHWHDWNEPIYVPHPDDEGLHWDLIDWQDSP